MPFPLSEQRLTCHACGWTVAERSDVLLPHLKICPKCQRDGVEETHRPLFRLPPEMGGPPRQTGLAAVLGDLARRVLGR